MQGWNLLILIPAVFLSASFSVEPALAWKLNSGRILGKHNKSDSPSAGTETRDSKPASLPSKIAADDKAPDLALPDQNGKIISLKEYRGKKFLLLYFYGRDNDSGCKAEACAFRDAYEKFEELGAEIVGVGADTVESHKDFARKNDLQFPLLSDSAGMARQAFGLSRLIGLRPGTAAYVIDKSGFVRRVLTSSADVARQAEDALKIIGELRSKEQAEQSAQ